MNKLQASINLFQSGSVSLAVFFSGFLSCQEKNQDYSGLSDKMSRGKRKGSNRRSTRKAFTHASVYPSLPHALLCEKHILHPFSSSSLSTSSFILHPSSLIFMFKRWFWPALLFVRPSHMGNRLIQLKDSVDTSFESVHRTLNRKDCKCIYSVLGSSSQHLHIYQALRLTLLPPGHVVLMEQ